MAKMAIMASVPVGMGHFHHDPSLTEDRIQFDDFDTEFHIDYYQGRMVKFYVKKINNGWQFHDKINTEYQSWARAYPSYESLYNAVKG